MSNVKLMLSVADIATLSASAQEELRQLIFPAIASDVPAKSRVQSEQAEMAPEVDEGPADLTVALCRRLIAQPIHDKSLAILRTIAESETPVFRMADALAAAPEANEPNDLRGAWSGLTRRTRKILSDDQADLIWWEGEGIFDEDDNYVDHVGRVSPLTHQSLRTAMSVRS